MKVSATGIFYLIGIILFFLGGLGLTVYGAVENQTWALGVGIADMVVTLILFVEYMVMKRWEDKSSVTVGG